MTSIRVFYALVLLVFLTFSFSCSSTSDQSATGLGGAERIVIDAAKVAKEVDVSDLIEEIRVFPLEEVEGSLLGDVEKVLLMEEYMVVFDKMETKKIVVFDRKGDFVKELNIVGEGPDKLTQIIDCWINDHGELEVYDYAAQKILVYDNNFEVEKAIHAKDRILFHSMMSMPGSGGYVGLSRGYSGVDGDPFKLAFLDDELAVQHTALPFDSLIMGASISVPISPLLRVGDDLRLYQNFDPRIYTANPEGYLEIAYYLDYVHQPLPDDFERELILQNLELFMDPYEDQRAVFEGYTGFRGRWMESRDYAVFESFDEVHDLFFSVYHKGKKQILAQGHDLRDDRRYHLALPTHFQAADVEDNRFVVAMPGWWLTNYLLPESPFYELVNPNPETVFVMEVVLK